MRYPHIFAFLCLALLASNVTAASPIDVPTDPKIVRQAVQDGERIWRSVNRAEPTPGLASRDLFTYALALAEAQEHLERLEPLFALATRMQNRDVTHRAYGNFRWSWRDAEVFDFNAVDFCMQAGSLLWLRHRNRLPESARKLLQPLLELGIEGLRRHRVTESYTNIALMNAGNLLLLGEAFGRADVVAEGAARLDRIVLYMAEAGVHEYTSPTYYGVDLDDVTLIATFTAQERARSQARALRELLWTDIALNWFGPAGKLGGARSRDYDYLRGLGYLDQQLTAHGWIKLPNGRTPGVIFLAYASEPLPPALLALRERFPRLITQTWGLERYETRTHYLCTDVTLSSAAAGYGGRMDLPLTVDLPGPRENARGYFIPDGRHDPYGQIKIQETQAHAKTLHLQPFWTAAQRRVDALGLALYRPKDVPADTKTLESHFVLPLAMDEIWVAGKPVRFQPKNPASYDVPPDATVVARLGTALVGLRVPWTRDCGGAPAKTALVYDGNAFGVMRLTVMHHLADQPVDAKALPGAAFWVRIGSGLATPATIEVWQNDFAQAFAQAAENNGKLAVQITGTDGPLTIAAQAPYLTPSPVVPTTPRQVLACDGDDLGARLLAVVEPVRSLQAKRGPVVTIAVPATGAISWEAETGTVVPPMTLGEDPQASRGIFAWMPAAPGERAGSAVGRLTWQLQFARAGNYYLWGRVLTPTPENDSFRLSANTGSESLAAGETWATGVHKRWEWVRVTTEGNKTPQPLPFAAGEAILELRVREAGAKIDRLFLTTDPKAQPDRAPPH